MIGLVDLYKLIPVLYAASELEQLCYTTTKDTETVNQDNIFVS